MTTQPTHLDNLVEDLEAALDFAAPDGGSWIAGREAFLDARQNKGMATEEAYHAALDAAAPDQGAWMAGYNLLFVRGRMHVAPPTPSSKLKQWFSRRWGNFMAIFKPKTAKPTA